MALEPNDLIAWRRLAQHRDLDEFRGLRAILAPELSRCFSQEVHEGQRLPYGVLIARDDDIGDLGRLIEIADRAQLTRALTLTDWPMIEHQVRHIDGAAVVDRNGRLLRRGVMLEASGQAQAIRVEGGPGTILPAATLMIGPT